MLGPGSAQLGLPILLQHRIALIVENLLAKTGSNNPFANSVIEGARRREGRAFLGQEVGRSVNWKVGGFQHEIPRQRKLDLRRAFLRRLILDVETIFPGQLVLRSKKAHIADAARSRFSEQKPPARHRARTMVCKEFLCICIGPGGCTTLLDMPALDLEDRAADWIAVIFAPSIRGTESFQTSVRRSGVDAKGISDVSKGFAREIGLHRAHFHLLIRRQAIPSLGQTGDATVEGRLLQIPSLNLNLHPIDELLAEFVEGVLPRLWLLGND
ncbi:MAG: hypothetical protein COB29_10210 [Sulfitobacter sp.]|nr:MAG: hypothetical protein COB29_10210 [Sulfitobacter sp.]